MKEKRPISSGHILQIEKNPSGCDHVMGDVHGGLSTLKKIHKSLKPEDRLFIVGDLIDRGEDSEGVIKYIMENKTPPIYVVRGNHEDDFLNVMETVKKKVSGNSLTNNAYWLLAVFIYNGGDWILDNNSMDPNVSNDLKSAQTPEDIYSILYHNSEKISFINYDERLKPLEEYIKTLPYIIQVGKPKEEENTFAIVHAEMPFDDETLQKRINSGEGLNPHEIENATKWRGDNTNGKRDHSEGQTKYCGHNIVLNPKIKSVDGTYINLDFGSFATNIAPVVNHTAGTITAIGLSERRSDHAPEDIKVIEEKVGLIRKQLLLRDPLNAACISLQEALTTASKETTDSDKKKISAKLLEELTVLVEKTQNDPGKRSKGVIELLYKAERSMSHHTNWFKSRRSTSTTKAFKAAYTHFQKTRVSLEKTKASLISQDKIIQNTAEAKARKKTGSFTYKQQLKDIKQEQNKDASPTKKSTFTP